MADPQLIEYITQLKNSGFSDEAIKQNLLNVGWQNEQIEAAFVLANQPQVDAGIQVRSGQVKKKFPTIVVIVIVIIAVIAVGVWIFFKFYSAKILPNSSSTKSTENTDNQQNISNGVALGSVNLQETICKELSILSAKSANATSGGDKVNTDGSFKTTISTDSAMMIMAVDNNQPCLTAIALPQKSNNIIFDADSTAKASVFVSIGVMTTDPNEAETRLNMIGNLNSYLKFKSYLADNLKTTQLTNITKQKEYDTLLTACVIEIAQRLGKM